MPSMRQLAKLAGVSVSTVSMALRDNPRISVDTRQRIQALVQEFGYPPNCLGRVFDSERSRLLGCVVHKHAGPYYSRILHGVLEEALAENFSMVVVQSGRGVEHAALAVRSLLEHRVEGIIIATIFLPPLPRETFFEIRHHGVVPVIIGNDLQEPVDHIFCLEDTIAATAVEYLWKLGHRSVGYVGNDDASEKHRNAAMRKALKHYGLTTDFLTLTSPRQLYEMYESVMAWLKKTSRPTAIILSDDSFADPLLYHLPSQGVLIPQDLSLLGIGNFAGDMSYQYLTTIDQHPQALGRQAVMTIRERLASGESVAEYAPALHAISPTLVERSTTGPPPRNVRCFANR